MRPIAFVLACALLPGVAAAQAPDCRAPKTQQDLNDCAAADYRRADQALNKVYGELRGHLGNGDKEALKAAQQAWIKFRDLDCRFAAGGVAGGSVAGAIVAACQQRKTEQRTKELDAFLHCPEGDLACPAVR